MMSRLAVLVDGDNISGCHAERILSIASRQGSPTVVRVYTNARRTSEWHDACGFRMIHAGTGKNASDVLLVIDAMELALSGGIDQFVIASSDGDFTHLAYRLREHGAMVTGVGEGKAPSGFRGACSDFVLIDPGPSIRLVRSAPPVADLDLKIRAIIAAASTKGAGMRLAALGASMHSKHGIRIGALPEQTWRAYLAARPHLYDLGPRGPDCMVRFKPEGFPAAA
ncbi:NYN domain-containing protein [Rhodovulum sulfidophilum]|nr:NYN domain-containing protein [Rhodovulum sulfidophilum]